MGAEAPKHVACPGCGQRYPWREGLAQRKLRRICEAKPRMPGEPSQPPTLLEHAPANQPPSQTASDNRPRERRARAPAVVARFADAEAARRAR